MKKMSQDQLMLLRRDLQVAKILVLLKHGFSIEEIADLTYSTVGTVRNLIKWFETNNDVDIHDVV